MTRELAIFLEVMDDSNFEGLTEFLILAYHDFVTGFELSRMSDVEVQIAAKELINKYQHFWYSNVDFSSNRLDILEKLNLDDAEWESQDEDYLTTTTR